METTAEEGEEEVFGGHLHIPSLRSVFKGRRSLFGRYCPRRGATGGGGIVCHSIPRSISLSGMSFRAATLNFPFSVVSSLLSLATSAVALNSTNVYLWSGGSGGCYPGLLRAMHPPGISVQKLKLLNLLRERFITLRFLLSLED